MGTKIRRSLLAGVVLGAIVFEAPHSLEAASGTTIFVASSANSSSADASCSSASYSKLQTALDAAGVGGTVHLCPGTYATQVTIGTPGITLVGTGHS